MAETTASYTHTTAAVIHQQEAVTADKVNITLISKPLVFIGGLQWNGPLFFFFIRKTGYLLFTSNLQKLVLCWTLNMFRWEQKEWNQHWTGSVTISEDVFK